MSLFDMREIRELQQPSVGILEKHKLVKFATYPMYSDMPLPECANFQKQEGERVEKIKEGERDWRRN